MANNPHNLRPPLTSMEDFLHFYAESKRSKGEEVFCFQVGANDGKINDPVHVYFRDYGWKGLLLEPQCDVFHQGLKKTYENNQNVILENVALGKESGSMPFYRVAISRTRWATGLSSFDLKSIQGHIDNGYIERKAKEEGIEVPADSSKLIEKVEVPTLKVNDLLSKHHIQKFEVLCIDTEGYDFEILKLIDLKKYAPEVIFFESKNLIDEDFKQAKSMLIDLGYKLFSSPLNINILSI
jgi:FkbM family methyltransferase